MNENFVAVCSALQLEQSHIRQLVINSFEASFLDPETKQRHVDSVLAFDSQAG